MNVLPNHAVQSENSEDYRKITDGLEIGFLKDNAQWASRVQAVDWNEVSSIEALIKATEQLVLKYPSPNQRIKESIKRVFETVLSRFPLLFGYWKRFTAVQYQLNGLQSSIEVLSQAVDIFPNSLELWCDYLNVLIANNPEKVDQIRVNFQIAKGLVGLQFLSHPFWDKYIKFETDQQNWENLATIYREVSHVPLHQYSKYYTAYKEFAQSNNSITVKGEEIDQIFLGTQKLVNQIWTYESQITQSFFNLSPLDQKQLDNWDQYLTFAIESDAVSDELTKTLFRRCLIPCRNYEHFWLRFTGWLEDNCDVDTTLELYERAINRLPVEMLALRMKYLDFLKKMLRTDKEKTLDQYLQTLTQFSKLYPSQTAFVVEFLSTIRRVRFSSDLSQPDQEILAQQTAYASYLERNVRSFLDNSSKGDAKVREILTDHNLPLLVVELIKVTHFNLKNAMQTRKYFAEFESLPQIRNSTAFWLLYYKITKIVSDFNELERFIARLGRDIFLPTTLANDIVNDFKLFFMTNIEVSAYENEVHERRYVSGIDPLLELDFKINDPLWTKPKPGERQRKDCRNNGYIGFSLDKPEITNTIMEVNSKDLCNGPPPLPTFKNLEKINKNAVPKDYFVTDYVNAT